MKENIRPAAGRLKKTLALAVLTGLMLTGCGGTQAATQPTATATAVAAVAENVTVPSVTGLTLDKATDQLEKLGFTVDAVDSAHGKSITDKKNWQVITQDPANGAQAAKGSTVHLGVKNLDDVAAEKAAAEKAAADKAAADKAAATKPRQQKPQPIRQQQKLLRTRQLGMRQPSKPLTRRLHSRRRSRQPKLRHRPRQPLVRVNGGAFCSPTGGRGVEQQGSYLHLQALRHG